MHALALTRPALLLGDDKQLARLAGTEHGVPVLALGELARTAQQAAGPLPDVAPQEDDPALLLFTSGTTGQARAATLSHRNLVGFGHVVVLGGAIGVLTSGRPTPEGQPTAFATSPLFDISGVGPMLSQAPLVGQQLVFPPPGPWDEVTHLRLTEQHGVTSWSGVPTQFWRLLGSPELDRYDTSRVTNVGIGGANLPPELIRLIQRRLPQARITNGSGTTETTGVATWLSDRRLDEHTASVGTPVPGVEVEVRDETGAPVPEGTVGEIHLRGPGVFLGYWDDPVSTAAALGDGRWYRTGDYGCVRDGVLQLESRMRDLILQGGENVYPAEVENRLVEHPDVADAAVIGVPHPVLGQEVKAFVVPRQGTRPGTDEVRSWVGEALAAFKVPAHVELCDSLPYSATGKVLKRLLEERSAP